MGMWALDSEDGDVVAQLDLQCDSPTSGQEGEPPGTRLARIEAQSLVLKPQREGGGNNFYGGAIPAFLGSLRAVHEAWIAMEIEMIETPREVGVARACPLECKRREEGRKTRWSESLELQTQKAMRTLRVRVFERAVRNVTRSGCRIVYNACTEVNGLGDQKDPSETHLFISHSRNFDIAGPMISGVTLSWVLQELRRF
ncbi:hypothetical protein M405DRAFT_842417 [Rhizopogon salebrosus TDB-379]|nr:hypothetical protein M405DRAFT_842417 [Rhizopogon salebrosus TDB-379]